MLAINKQINKIAKVWFNVNHFLWLLLLLSLYFLIFSYESHNDRSNKKFNLMENKNYIIV